MGEILSALMGSGTICSMQLKVLVWSPRFPEKRLYPLHFTIEVLRVSSGCNINCSGESPRMVSMVLVMPKQAILQILLSSFGAQPSWALCHQTSEAQIIVGTIIFAYSQCSFAGFSPHILPNIPLQTQKAFVVLLVSCSRCDLYVNYYPYNKWNALRVPLFVCLLQSDFYI